MTPASETPDPPEGAAVIEQKIAEYAKIGLPIGAVLGAALAGALQGPAAAILVLAGGALVAVIAIFWASVRTLVGETPLAGADAYAIGAPRAEEEQKRAVLRALKDLEFERSVGKISEEDYDVLVARYRAEAKALLRALDAEAMPRREQVEALVTKRLRREGLADGDSPAYRQRGPEGRPDAGDDDESAPPAKAKDAKAARKRKKADGRAPDAKAPAKTSDTDEVEPTETLVSGAGFARVKPSAPASDDEARGAKESEVSPPDAPASDAPASEPKAPGDDADSSKLTCSSCATVNDVDAVFCKKCGQRQRPAGGAS